MDKYQAKYIKYKQKYLKLQYIIYGGINPPLTQAETELQKAEQNLTFTKQELDNAELVLKQANELLVIETKKLDEANSRLQVLLQ